ncbi:MAG: AI-2E family transporter, partial [Clostridia bacterium]|nr:AI-2E family transporter [Clostridia bacterium]
QVEHFFVVALLISLVDLLPIFGTGTVLLPWAVINFLTQNYYKGLGIVLLYITITVIRNFLEPKLIGEQFDINPIFTLIFLFLGFRIGGIMGMLALPIFFTVLFTYYRNKFSTNA